MKENLIVPPSSVFISQYPRNGDTPGTIINWSPCTKQDTIDDLTQVPFS